MIIELIVVYPDLGSAAGPKVRPGSWSESSHPPGPAPFRLDNTIIAILEMTKQGVPTLEPTEPLAGVQFYSLLENGPRCAHTLGMVGGPTGED